MTTVTLTISETRPNLNVLFYRTPNDFINYIQRYNDIRHRTVLGWTTSDDLLTRTHTATFNTRADLDTYLSDPEVIKHEMVSKEYNDTNVIIRNKNIV
jgi:hypothetical protein